MPAKRSVNFLLSAQWEQKSFGRFLKWAFSYGRYIVIFTELIVIMAFLSRFKLDRDLTNLSEQITQKEQIITSAGGTEKQFLTIQNQTKKIKAIINRQYNQTEMLTQIAAMMPQDIQVQSLVVNGSSIRIQAVSATEFSLATLVNNINANDNFSSVRLTSVSSSTRKGTGISFDLETNYTSPAQQL